MLRKIDCVMVCVDDLEAGARYYADLFGLKRLWSSESVGMGMSETDAEIVLHTTDNPESVSVHYLVDDVRAAVDDLQWKGCLVREAPFDIAIGECAVIEDELGNIWAILDMSKGPRTD